LNNRVATISTALLMGLAFSSTSQAVMIDNPGGSYDGQDVGVVDTFLAEGAQQGNPTDETAWVNAILGDLGVDPVTYYIKEETVAYYGTDTTDVFAFLMGGNDSEYYLIKNATRIALFQNLADLDWGVFDVSFLSENMNFGGESYAISHVTRFDGTPTTTVPEPSTLALFGLGLVGLGMARRRKA